MRFNARRQSHIESLGNAAEAETKKDLSSEVKTKKGKMKSLVGTKKHQKLLFIILST